MNRRYLKSTLYAVAVFALLLFAPASQAFFVEPSSEASNPVDVIVIDPGHGGVDSGALGRGGLTEKDVVLGVAMGLRDVLRERLPEVKVLLTRENDTFIPLEERIGLANSAHADIFISIHVNAARNKKASGVETFFLSYLPTDAEAMELAEAENRVVQQKSGKSDDEVNSEVATNDLKNILHDLAQSVTHHESSALAEAIQVSMVKGTGRPDRGVKQAPFTVLEGASMPAVLVEVGFISNRREERWLKGVKVHKRIADSIAHGITEFAVEVNRRAARIKSDERAER
ncbi:MAG: N-acetylmuramoyl-L-alanine amidase [Proteobacteria bacterium]|nr:N-acetylmuramoyl-L-alanine amidase [Pseudomonadota bacterium]